MQAQWRVLRSILDNQNLKVFSMLYRKAKKPLGILEKYLKIKKSKQIS